ncbi:MULTISPECIES: hypothetical protein [Clostridium]|uniref:Uncharacterized protein n=2 Tax=Clostridium TaxID=1485 RepID=D8GIT4_CLOLD|nr:MULTISPECIES: hypothetical protein [Clostridium]ADK15009.1 hypothetical protein CLJU_c19470 [Clostridium ljungdahlii DSM 13528]AGY74261.1 hypothetical protein CAETHG_0024 [Clostridium autoethanogenum DSM 10061]ALU34452.1 Hypothetical protein CLAU_0023 [Clostridium autoethanogenum DSM 10061]OAA87670.1 hypothetical protein WX45_03232 [Clostridium ljungdahlii DSM 13528]OVY51172.1 hypothetical protein WX72_02334 [Clostridium autoethanogenum]
MLSKKVLSLILAVGVIGGVSAFQLTHHAIAKSTQGIKVTAYKPSAKVNENGYQIDKYENIESTAWINENEVLTLTRKSEFKNADSTRMIRYCSIYNLNTKSSKDFKNANIDEFLGISPDNKFVLYAEARNIPVETQEWKNALASGDLLHKNVKLLNLSTGQITDVNTEKLNSDAQFIWVSKDKILANYFNHWAVIDTTGKVYADGNYNGGEHDDAWISGVDDIKDLGSSVEGKFYYTQYEENGKKGLEGIKLCSMDVKTKEIKDIYDTKYSLHADKKGKTIIMDNYNNNGDAVDGVYVNRTFGALVMNESGKVLQDIKLPKGRISSGVPTSEYILSPDGSKAAYVERNNEISHQVGSDNKDPDIAIKVIDTKTGDTKEIVKASSLKDKNEGNNYTTIKIKDKDGNVKEKKIKREPGISNISWDSTSTALSFTYGSSSDPFNKDNINTYIVTFDK